MFLDVKNSQITKELPESISVDMKTFWQYYLKMLTIEKGNFVSDQEINLLSSLMVRDLSTSWFKSPFSEELKKECDLKTANFNRLLYSLRDKGLLVEGVETRDYLLCNPLVKQKKQFEEMFKKNKEINFIYPFKVNYNE